MREGLEVVCRLIAPMTPHLAEEMWAGLGQTRRLTEVPWPEPDPALLVEATVTIAVQVNGKKRAVIELPSTHDRAAAEAAAMAEAGVQRAIGAKQVRKIIVVPGKIVNVVV